MPSRQPHVRLWDDTGTIPRRLSSASSCHATMGFTCAQAECRDNARSASRQTRHRRPPRNPGANLTARAPPARNPAATVEPPAGLRVAVYCTHGQPPPIARLHRTTVARRHRANGSSATHQTERIDCHAGRVPCPRYAVVWPCRCAATLSATTSIHASPCTSWRRESCAPSPR